TADIVHAVARAAAPVERAAEETSAEEESLPENTTLYARRQPRTLPHPAGFHADPVNGRSCQDCGWFTPGRSPEQSGYCQQTRGRVEPRWPSCERFEETLDCLACGACCREAYDAVL